LPVVCGSIFSGIGIFRDFAKKIRENRYFVQNGPFLAFAYTYKFPSFPEAPVFVN